jgi:hypothetical protein
MRRNPVRSSLQSKRSEEAVHSASSIGAVSGYPRELVKEYRGGALHLAFAQFVKWSAITAVTAPTVVTARFMVRVFLPAERKP